MLKGKKLHEALKEFKVKSEKEIDREELKKLQKEVDIIFKGILGKR